MGVSYFTSNTVYTVADYRILLANDLSPVPSLPIQPTDMFLAYNATFNNQVNSSSQDSSSMTTAMMNFITLFNQMAQNSDEDFLPGVNYLRAFLALPLVIFQPTSYWPDDQYIIANGNFSTTAAYGLSVSRLIIDPWTVITFAGITVSVYLYCVVWLCWGMHCQLPTTTQFPLLDFASRVASGKSIVQHALSDATVSGFKESLQHKRLFLGEIIETHEAEEELKLGSSIAESVEHDVSSISVEGEVERREAEHLEDSETIGDVSMTSSEWRASVERILDTIDSERGSHESLRATQSKTRQDEMSNEVHSLLKEELPKPLRIGFAFQGKDVIKLKRRRKSM
jgi:hypothetical protein